jgi:pimeloyl-ACP methyl ester carboxylesterase
VLQFIENFVVEFVETLDTKVPVKGKVKAIVGGSLGGNIALRLGRRTDLPWLPAVIAWSPASIWDPLADGADIVKHQAPLSCWLNAGGDPSNLGENAGFRPHFFEKAFDDAIPFDPAQPLMWYRKDWPCINSEIVADRLDRQEIYDGNFRLWHWRLAAEQLIYSHQANDPNTGKPLYLQNLKPMLLGAGKDDDFHFADICSATEHVAEQMVNTPGKALFLQNTGHSIHNERPNYWAEQWTQFIARLN